MAGHNGQDNSTSHLNPNQAIERIIRANPLADVIESERVLIMAIPGVEQMYFGMTLGTAAPYGGYVRIRLQDEQALQTNKTHPNHTAFGAQQWVPIIADQIVIDYRLQF